MFNLLKIYLQKKTEELNKKGIKFKVIGNKKILPIKLLDIIKESEKITKNNSLLQLNLALNYGSKNEIVETVNLMVKQKIKLNKSNIEKNLFTSDSPDPDLLIRTGNTNRLSNFLLWQVAYSEIYFEKKLWPDFNEKDYRKIIDKFKRTKRNFGNI